MKILFENGIPGFEELREFTINDIEGSKEFKVMDSVENEEIGFVGIFPFDRFPEYEIDLQTDITDELKIENHKDVLVFNLITVGKNLAESTVNLKAPIIINLKNSKAKQVILQTEKYTTKQPLVRSKKNVSNY